MTSSNKVSSVQHRANNIVDPTLFSTAVVLVLSLDTQLTSANTNWMHHYNFVFSLSIKQQHEKHHLKIYWITFCKRLQTHKKDVQQISRAKNHFRTREGVSYTCNGCNHKMGQLIIDFHSFFVLWRNKQNHWNKYLVWLFCLNLIWMV